MCILPGGLADFKLSLGVLVTEVVEVGGNGAGSRNVWWSGPDQGGVTPVVRSETTRGVVWVWRRVYFGILRAMRLRETPGVEELQYNL